MEDAREVSQSGAADRPQSANRNAAAERAQLSARETVYSSPDSLETCRRRNDVERQPAGAVAAGRSS